VAENRSKFAKEGMRATTIMEEVAAAWQSLSQEQRRPYTARAELATVAYQRDLEVFKASALAEPALHDADAAAAAVTASHLGGPGWIGNFESFEGNQIAAFLAPAPTPAPDAPVGGTSPQEAQEQ
jgi:cell wall assembly regulator SMI1